PGSSERPGPLAKQEHAVARLGIASPNSHDIPPGTRYGTRGVLTFPPNLVTACREASPRDQGNLAANQVEDPDFSLAGAGERPLDAHAAGGRIRGHGACWANQRELATGRRRANNRASVEPGHPIQVCLLGSRV